MPRRSAHALVILYALDFGADMILIAVMATIATAPGTAGVAGCSSHASSPSSSSCSSSSRKFMRACSIKSRADLSSRCLSARRRRKNGYNPYYGTGWTVRHGTPTYNQNVQPQYETSSTPYYNNSNNPPPGMAQYSSVRSC